MEKFPPTPLVGLSLLLVACGGGNGPDSPTSEPTPQVSEPDPQLSVSAAGLDLEAILGAGQNATARFSVSNSGGGTLSWLASTGVTGVSASPAEGRLGAGESEDVALALDCVAALPPAQQPREESGTVNVRAIGLENQARDIGLRIACVRPEITIELRPPAQAEGRVGDIVNSSAEFRFISNWMDQPPLEYEVSSGYSEALPSPENGQAIIEAWESIGLSHQCIAETEFAVIITLRIDGQESSFEWQVSCRARAGSDETGETGETGQSEVTEENLGFFVGMPRTGHGTLSGTAGGTVRILLYSRGQALPVFPLAYTITSDDPNVALNPSEGIAEDTEWQRADLTYQCRGERSFTARITIQAGGLQREFDWPVVCGLGNAWAYSIEVYQGPILQAIRYNDDTTFDQNYRAFVSPIAGRDVLVVARVHHTMPTAPEAWAYAVPETTREREGAGLKSVHGPSTLAPGEERPGGPGDIMAAIPRHSYAYESEFAFLFSGGLPTGYHGFEIDVDPQDLVPEGDEADNDRGVATFVETNAIDPLRIVFVPIEVNGVAPDIETYGGVDALMKDAMDFLPLSGFAARVRDTPMIYSGPFPFDMEHAFEQLKQEWLTDEDVSGGDFYHGLVAIDGLEGGQAAYNSPDALPTFIPIAVSSLSRIQSATSGGRIIAHEIGHNVSLYHAPCNVSDASTLHPRWPSTSRSYGTYDDAGIGPDRGYRFSEMEFVAPGTEDAHDFMSYCSPGFVSPISYGDAHDFLLLLDQYLPGDASMSWSPGASSARASTSTSKPGIESGSLAISGSVSEFGAWSLFSARHTAKPPWPGGGGNYTLLLLSGSGAPLGEIKFDPVPLGHGNRQTWGVRIAMPQAAQPARVRITDEYTQVVLDAALESEKEIIGTSGR